MFLVFPLCCVLFIPIVHGSNHIGPPSCPEHFYGDKSLEKCYGFQKQQNKHVFEARTWLESAKSCALEPSGTLAIIPSEAQGALQFLRDRAIQLGIPSAWVAVTDSTKRDAFEWMDRTPFNPAGVLKPSSHYPKSHDVPNCIYFHFSAQSADVTIGNSDCYTEKKNYICQFPLYIPDEERKSSARGNKRLNMESGSSSLSDITKLMPKDLPGAAKILPTSADKLIMARELLITEVFGSPFMRDDEIDKVIPDDLYSANLTVPEQVSVKGLLKQMIGGYFEQSRAGNSTETGKSLMNNLMEEGRAIRCMYGVNGKQRKVECLGTTGVFKACLRVTAVDGTVVRDCGLPGAHNPGCHETIQGVVCFCEKDLCNFSSSNFPKLSKIVIQIFAAILVSFRFPALS